MRIIRIRFMEGDHITAYSLKEVSLSNSLSQRNWTLQFHGSNTGKSPVQESLMVS